MKITQVYDQIYYYIVRKNKLLAPTVPRLNRAIRMLYSSCVVFALHSCAMALIGFKHVDFQITSSLVDPI